MLTELYALKPFALGVFITAYLSYKWAKFNKPKCYVIKEWR